MVECSCCYYQTFVIPCCHITTLLLIKSHHLHIFWCKKYSTLYKGEGYEDVTKELLNHPSHYDHCIIVNFEDYNITMKTANTIEQVQDVDDPLFLTEYILYQRCEHRMIRSSMLENKDMLVSRSENGVYDGGNLSQETCGVDDSEDESGIGSR